MFVLIYYVPGQTAGRRKAFSERKSIYLSSKQFRTCWGNVNYYKSVYHPITTRGNREHPGNFQNKSVSLPFNWVSRYIIFLAKLKIRGRPFLEGARRGCVVRLPQRPLGCYKTWKSLSFVKFEIILPLLLFFIKPSYK